jgi:hypothetical protein
MRKKKTEYILGRAAWKAICAVEGIIVPDEPVKFTVEKVLRHRTSRRRNTTTGVRRNKSHRA